MKTYLAYLLPVFLPLTAYGQSFFDVLPFEGEPVAEETSATILEPYQPIVSRQVEDLGPFMATFKLIRKRLNRVEDVTLARDGVLDIDGDLTVTTRACIPNHGGVSGNFGAYVSVQTPTGAEIFNGWLFSTFPGLSSLQDNRYDLLLVRCKFDG